MKFKNIFNGLYFIDLFQHDVSLKLHDRYRISSHFGKLLSLGIIIFLTYNFFTSDMIQKTNPIVLTQDLEGKKRPEISLDQSNFVLAFAVIDFDNQIRPEDPTIFSYEISKYNLVTKENNWTTTFINSQFCNSSYFDRFPNEFTALNLSYATCISTTDIFLRGGFEEEIVDIFHFSIQKCRNNSWNSEKGIVCKSPQEIDNLFKQSFISIWVEQKNFDMKNYGNPISSKIKYYSRGLQNDQYKTASIFLKKVLIETDDAAIYPGGNTIESYAHENVEYDVLTAERDGLMFDFYLYSGATVKIFKRNYQKLFTLIASLGGILSSLTVFCSILVKLAIEWKTNEFILNTLHIFVNEFKNFTFKKTNLISPFPPLQKKLSSIEVETKQNEENKPKVESKKKLVMSLFELINLFFKRKKNRTEKEKIYVEYMEKVNKKIDLVEVLKKLEEVEKMKYVIFNEEQLILFNSITERLIYSKNKGVVKYNGDMMSINENKKKKIENNIIQFRKREKKLIPLIKDWLIFWIYQFE